MEPKIGAGKTERLSTRRVDESRNATWRGRRAEGASWGELLEPLEDKKPSDQEAEATEELTRLNFGNRFLWTELTVGPSQWKVGGPQVWSDSHSQKL
jgi:hypothetical protein